MRTKTPKPALKACTICSGPFPATPNRRKTCSDECARELKSRNRPQSVSRHEFVVTLDCGCVPVYSVKPSIDDSVWCSRCDGPATVDSVTRHVVKAAES